MNFLASSLLFLFLLGNCHAFTSPLQRHHTTKRAIASTTSILEAITKQQTYILDGAELSYYIKGLQQQQQQQALNNNNSNDIQLPNLAPRSPNKSNRIGCVTFVTITLDDDIKKYTNGEEEDEVWLKRGTEIIGVVVPPSSIDDKPSSTDVSTRENIISINGVQLYQDSIAILPTTTRKNKKKKVLHADYISTAATALLLGSTTSQQHDRDINIVSNNNKDESKNDESKRDAENNKDEKKKKRVVVIVGGGNYALYLATAYNTLGYKVHVVSARPSWSLPSPSDLTPKKMDGSRVVENGVVEIIPPSVGKLSLGFTSAIGE